MVRDNVMRKLMRQHDKPVHQRLGACAARHGPRYALGRRHDQLLLLLRLLRLLLWLLHEHAAQVQLLEEAEVAEDAALAVEGNGRAAVVAEDVHAGGRQRVDARAVAQHAGEQLERGPLRGDKGVRVAGEVPREEELSAGAGVNALVTVE